MSEATEQAALIRWSKHQSDYPELSLMFHIPNGGTRRKFEAWRLQQQGVKKGVPDLFLPVARGNYHGLFIELKKTPEPGKPKPSVTKEQRDWATQLQAQMYQVCIVFGLEEAKRQILLYMALSR